MMTNKMRKHDLEYTKLDIQAKEADVTFKMLEKNRVFNDQERIKVEKILALKDVLEASNFNPAASPLAEIPLKPILSPKDRSLVRNKMLSIIDSL